jgi:ATP-dependent Clp protease adaptor protein ClpS
MKLVICSTVTVLLLGLGNVEGLRSDSVDHGALSAFVPYYPSSLAKSMAGSRVTRNALGSFKRSMNVKPMKLAMNTGGSILEKSKTVSPAPMPTQEKEKEKLFHVLLFNDPMNTREYVCSVLVQVFGHSKGEAYNIMQLAHSQGFSICNTTGKDEADTQCATLQAARLTSSVMEAE